MKNRDRIAALEARVADLEARLFHRDWGALPPAYYIPSDEVPTTMSAYAGPALDEWRSGVYV